MANYEEHTYEGNFDSNLSTKPLDLTLTAKDFYLFKKWINIDIHSVTWQGKYQKDFEEFWNIFFTEGFTLKQIIGRFNYAINKSSIGPLISWFNWIKEKFIYYIFVHKNLTIFQISIETEIHPRILTNIFRNATVEKFPHLSDIIDTKLQISNMTSENLNTRFSDIVKDYSVEDKHNENLNDEIMTALEVTLYEDWQNILSKLKKDFVHSSFNFDILRKRINIRQQFIIFRDLIVLTIICILIIYGIQYANIKYEKYLADKISIYEPQFKWLDEPLIFKSEENNDKSKLSAELKNLEKIEKDKNLISANYEDEERFDVESEVILTSWDSIPKDFGITSHEWSMYEESRRRGYRESQYGNTKVYRVLIKSEDLVSSKERLNNILKKYNVTQVDNVKPGLEVPGGIYYNIYVPIEYLKEFMAQVMEGDAVLYESRTRTKRNPPGQNKIFIWIKSI